jgi:hypothetical protein
MRNELDFINDLSGVLQCSRDVFLVQLRVTRYDSLDGVSAAIPKMFAP